MWKKPWVLGIACIALVWLALSWFALTGVTHLFQLPALTNLNFAKLGPQLDGARLEARFAVPPRALPRAPQSIANEPSKSDDEHKVDEQLRRLSLDAKASQLFIVGFMGERIEHSLAASISANKPGAIIFFGRNIRSAAQVSALTYAAQKASFDAVGLPILIAVDQEGGNVVRIRTAPTLPSALAIGDTHEPELAREAGRSTGKLLRALGFNMNLAPVMDVTDPAVDAFMGTRTFGDDPQLVSRMAGDFAKGLQNSGVLPTGKHFPGHGGLNSDSHLATPVKRATLADLLKRDIIPFAEAAKSELPPAIMIAHVVYPDLDPSGTPATFSKPIITDLLRKRLGFEGIAMTDDIEMAGAAAIADPRERAIRAVEAGADLVMIGWNKKLQRNLRLALIQAVRSGRIAESRIDESVRRILRAKARYAGPLTAPNPRAIRVALEDDGLRTIAERVLRAKFERAISAVDRKFFDDRAQAPIFVFSANEKFYASFKESITGRSTRHWRLDAAGGVNIDRIMRANPAAVGVFYVSGAKSASLAAGISNDVSSRIVLVNSEARSALKNSASFRHVVDVYFRHAATGRLTAEAFFPLRPRRPASL